jgi:YidC/Oxa1 family membrane protein insertase
MTVLFAYQEFLQWRYPDLYGPKAKHSPLVVATPGGVSGSPEQQANAPATRGMEAAAGALGTAAGGAIKPFAEQLVVVDTDFYEATLTSHGARLESFKLKKYRATAAPQSPDYELIRPGERMPIGMLVIQNDARRDDADIAYSTSSPTKIQVTGQAPVQVSFTGTTPDGLKLTKTFTFRDSSYVFDVTGQAATSNGAAPSGLGLTMSQPMTPLSGYRDNPEVQADVQGKPMAALEKAVQKGIAPLNGQISYAGFGDRYFLAAFLPETPQSGTFAVTYANGEADTQLIFTGAGQIASRVYMGPKALDVLEAVDPALSKAIDLGFWGIIALPFLRLLKLFYHFIPNYGVAIILVTVLVRLATLPISIRGQRSMMRMQRLQPQITRLREKYKDESDKLNREMVDLYKRNHVNPLGGCLPMLVQFPVFIGLYQALLNAVDLRHAAFVGWIRDLSAPDCLHIAGIPEIPFTTCHGIPALVLLMTASTFLQQWLMPRQPDPSQQKMMMIMPLAFSFIFLQLPSGLTLYYFASNLLGIVQQIVLNKEFQQAPAETPK